MRNLKRLATSLVAVALLVAFTSCEKQEAKSTETEVSFEFSNPFFKKVLNDIPPGVLDCNPDGGDAAVVHVVINDGTTSTHYDLNILIDATNESQIIKLNSRHGDGSFIEYTIEAFWVEDDHGNVLYVAPEIDSDFDDEFDLDNSYLVGRTFEVEDFTKLKIPMWVFCYMPENYTEFGFRWFQYTAFEVKSLCFFGDVCSGLHGDDYEIRDLAYNPYFGRDLGLDFHAIYEVIIRDDQGGIVARGTNYSDSELTHPVCVNILDDVSVSETYTYEIWWYAFVWGTNTLKKWPAFGPTSFTDAVWSDNVALGNAAFGGGDGILDFVIYDQYTFNQGIPCLDETADVSVQIQMDAWAGYSVPWDQVIN